MDSHIDSQELFARWQNGDQAAAQAILYRDMERLVTLARTRVAPAIRARENEEDVVQ